MVRVEHFLVPVVRYSDRGSFEGGQEDLPDGNTKGKSKMENIYLGGFTSKNLKIPIPKYKNTDRRNQGIYNQFE